MRKIVIALLALLTSAGCALQLANPRLTLRYEKGLESAELAALMSRAGPGPVGVVDLGKTAWVSHHLAVVRVAEQPHYHRFHDLTVVVMRGEGVLDLEGRKIAMKAGDVAHIQRGARHFFRNTASDPAAAFVTYSPPFDGHDTVTAELPAAKKKAEEDDSGERWWRFWNRSAEDEP
ncbi:MAG: cupin domain-containing protein [Candidatus Binatia bacterium]